MPPYIFLAIDRHDADMCAALVRGRDLKVGIEHRDRVTDALIPGAELRKAFQRGDETKAESRAVVDLVLVILIVQPRRWFERCVTDDRPEIVALGIRRWWL